jgi:hypothetical protein
MDNTRVLYHGSQTNAHGKGTLSYDKANNWHVIITDAGHYLYRVRRSSFTMLEEEVDTA